MGCADMAPNHARPRFSIIDVHTHLGGVRTWPGKAPNFGEIVRTMKRMNVELVVDFKAPDNSLANGVFGDRVTQRIAQYPDPTRFKLFANVPIDGEDKIFLGSQRADYPEWIAGILDDAVRRGAAGLKIKIQAGSDQGNYWTRDTSGTLVPFDSPAFDPLWDTAERLGVPVLVHLGGAYKGEHQPGNGNDKFRWEVFMLERERVLRKHPRLKMIAAHWAGAAGDRPYLAEFLEKYPNAYAEGGAHQSDEEFAELDSAEKAFFIAYQDQVMFGTDYMENTFDWLKSYRARLDMFLPFTERWPLPDDVMGKYYHGNARRLLRLPGANETPVAHPGFSSTQVIGDTVTLDGSASYGAVGTPLQYRWRQVEGPPLRLYDDTTSKAWFVANDVAQYTLELTVRSSSSQSRARRVRVTVVPPHGQFVEDSGRVVIEAEHFARAIGRRGEGWAVARERDGYSGDGYVATVGGQGLAVEPGEFRANSAELQYTVWIQDPGTYVAYARGMAADSERSVLHFGLDNEEARLADRVGHLPPGEWGWVRDAFEWDAHFKMTDATLAVLNIAAPGPHVLNVWVPQGGVMLDRIMLVRIASAEVSKPLFDPGVTVGPPESRKRTALGTSVPCEGSGAAASAAVIASCGGVPRRR
jgi:predicted TIM-barrel fold metal-dependent hydrolase